ncbi:hypothetical protein ACHAXN_005048 [Cyclotella atomus]
MSSPELPHTNPLICPSEEFARDAEQRLGRANGNTFQRRPAAPESHDGQIMIRLKKKRFIVIDYGIIPTEQDVESARDIPYIVVPEGAGERLCATRDCPRVGVPVQLFDSEPNETASLYLRGGLCFSCQRNLNEKRRTQRKRKSDAVDNAPSSASHGSGTASHAAAAMQPQQRYRLNGSILDLNPDAVIINGPIEGTRTRGPDYQYPRIGQDLLHLVSELHRGSHALLSTAYRAQSMGTAATPAGMAQINALFQSTFRDMSRATYLITQWKASWDETIGGSMLQHHQQQQAHAHHAAAAAGIPSIVPMPYNGHDMGGITASLSAAAAAAQQQHTQQQMNALMAPAAASIAPLVHQPQQPQPQAQQGRGNGEEKNNYDLSDFYEEV